MAIEKGNQGPKNKPQSTMEAAMAEAKAHKADAQTPPPGAQGGAQAQDTRPRPGGLDTLFNVPMTRRSTGETTAKLKAALEELMKSDIQPTFGDGFQMVALDRNASNVTVSDLLVCFHERVQGKDYVAVYNLLVEDSVEGLVDRSITHQGRTYTIPAVVSDLYDDELWYIVMDYVSSHYGLPNAEIIDAGVRVIPAGITAENGTHLRDMLFVSTQACFNTMDSAQGRISNPFSIKIVKDRVATLTAKVKYHAGQTEDSGGLPIRSDVAVRLLGNLPTKSNSGVGRAAALSAVDGYIDLVFDPESSMGQPQGFNQGFAFGQQQVAPGIHYYPRFVMTRVDSQIPVINMETQLLALSSALLMGNDGAWAGAFNPSPDQRGRDLDFKDIGAIGYEVPLQQLGVQNPENPHEKLPTKKDSFTPGRLMQLLGTTVHNKLIYSMDIEEAGDLTWVQSEFIRSANDDADAYRLVMEAASRLTDRAFEEYFEYGAPICVDDNTKVLLGYYIDPVTEERRDIRDIDYLAMLNIAGGRDLNVVARWGNIFDQVSVPMEVRLDEMYNLLDEALRGNLTITGRAHRITWSRDFLLALDRSCKAAGLDVRPADAFQTAGEGLGRGNQNASRFAVGGHEAGTFFNHATGDAWGDNRMAGLHNRFSRHGRGSF